MISRTCGTKARHIGNKCGLTAQRPRLISAKVAAALRNRLDPTSNGLPLADPPLNLSTLAVEAGPPPAGRPPLRAVQRELGLTRFIRTQNVVWTQGEPIAGVTAVLRRFGVPVGQFKSADQRDLFTRQQRIKSRLVRRRV
jgi:hypothetical protein